MLKRQGYEVNLGSGLESFLYCRSLWALWLTPWEFAGDLGRWNSLRVYRIFRWKKKNVLWMKNRQKQVSWLRGTNRSQSLISDPKSGQQILCHLTLTKLSMKYIKLWSKLTNNPFEIWELIKMSFAFLISGLSTAERTCCRSLCTKYIVRSTAKISI